MTDSILNIVINPQTVRLGLLSNDLVETVSVKLGDMIFEVSSSLLTANSLDLRNIINYQACKYHPITIDMTDVISPLGFVKVLDLLNLRERIDMTIQEGFEVMKFVTYYDMVPLQVLMRTGLKARIEEHHICRLIEFAKKFNIDSLMTQCQQYLKDRTRTLLQQRQIEFDNEELLAQLMDRDLMIDPTEITESIIRWTKNNRGSNKGIRTSRLLEAIRNAFDRPESSSKKNLDNINVYSNEGADDKDLWNRLEGDELATNL